jgi:hypothetical protein
VLDVRALLIEAVLIVIGIAVGMGIASWTVAPRPVEMGWDPLWGFDRVLIGVAAGATGGIAAWVSWLAFGTFRAARETDG